MPTQSGRRALWYHKTNVTQSMRAQTDVYIEPKESKRHLADSYWEQRSQMLLPHRLRLQCGACRRRYAAGAGRRFNLDTLPPPRSGHG